MIMVIETKEYLSESYLSPQEKTGVKIENNFIDLLPGKYFFNFSSKSSVNQGRHTFKLDVAERDT